MHDYTKEEFISVWEDSTRKEILNQFYYEHILLQKVYEAIVTNNEMIDYLQNRIDNCLPCIHDEEILEDIKKILKGDSNAN